MYRVMDWGKYGRPQELAKEDFVENKGKTKRDKVKDNKSDESQEVLATTLR